jgi:hypothetical protein
MQILIKNVSFCFMIWLIMGCKEDMPPAPLVEVQPTRSVIWFKTTECNDRLGGWGSFSRICNDSLFIDYAIESDGIGNQKWSKTQ